MSWPDAGNLPVRFDPRTLIEPQSNRVQITLRDAREVGSSREALGQDL